ncbi:MAG: EAL domain-containing protein [Clostridiales bacterium]|nr:EAL domain-containing protein [Clostridiales bacterium]
MDMGKQDARKIMLIVDDNVQGRIFLTRTFSSEYDIVEAVNGAEALELIKAYGTIDVVVLNVDMPTADGFEVLEKMGESRASSQIPVVVITQKSDEDIQLKALGLGAVDVITKPFSPRVMIRRIKNILARGDMIMAAEENKLYEIELKRREEQLYFARHDTLTGLLNRNTFIEEVSEAVRNYPENSFLISCMDIDSFNILNDRYGHEEGDRLLKFVADIRREELFEIGGIVCRDTADVFLILLPNDEEMLQTLTEHFFKAIAEYDLDIPINIHIGRYIIDDPKLDVGLMIGRAMLAMRSVKNSVNQRIGWFDDEMLRQYVRRQELTNEMQPALEKGQFLLYFQPQYNYDKDEMTGAEVLVRWKNPEKGMIFPGEFIPIFENNGFISTLDRYVWEQACIYMREWIKKGLNPVPLSVNVSKEDIRDSELPDRFDRLVKKYGLQPWQLHLEITESAYVDQPEQLISTVHELQQRGFVVEMDDFGSGYSSLNTLKDVPVDILKLDMAFNIQTEGQSRSGSILSSVVRMAHWLRLPVIAEGVETELQADYLESIGCYLMQGYYFAKPMPVEEYEKLLSTVRMAHNPYSIYTAANIKGAIDFLDASAQATLMFNSFMGGAQIVEFDGKCVESLRANNRFFEVIGTTREEYDKWRLNLLDRFHPDSQARLVSAFEESFDTDDEAQCEVHFVPDDRDEQGYWTLVRVRFLVQNGHRRLYYMTVENITERKVLDAMRQRLDDIVSNVPAGIAIFQWSEEIKPLYLSNRACEMFGYTWEEDDGKIINDALMDFMSDTNYFAMKTADELMSEDKNEGTFVAKRRDGSRFWLRIVFSVVKGEGPLPLVYATLLDVTQQRTERQELDLLMQSIPGGFFRYSADDEDSIDFVSDNMLEMLGYNRQEFKDKFNNSFHSLIYEEDKAKVEKITEKFKDKTYKQASMEYRIETKSGDLKWVYAQGHLMEDVDGKRWFHVVLTDISERIKSEEKLRIEREKTDFAIRNAKVTIWEYNIANKRHVMLGECQSESNHPIMENVPEAMITSHIIAEESVKDFMGLYDAIHEGEPSASGNILVLTEDGQNQWQRISYQTIFENGKPVGAIGTAVNIATEAKAIARQRELELALEAATLYFWTYNFETETFPVINKNAARLGIGRIVDGRQAGIEDSQWLLPSSRAKVRELLKEKKAFASEKETIINLHMDRTQCGMEWMKLTLAPVFDGAGELISLVAIGEDCTQIIENEKMYADALARTDHNESGSVFATLIVDITDDNVEACYGTFAEIGQSYTEAQLGLCKRTYTPDQRAIITDKLSKDAIIQAFSKGVSVIDVEYQRMMDGEVAPHWVRTTAKTFLDNASGHIKSLHYSIDIDKDKTERDIAAVIAENSYELLGMVFMDSGYIRCLQHLPLEGEAAYEKDCPYEESTAIFIDNTIREDSRERAREALSLEGLRTQLKENTRAKVVLPVVTAGELTAYKKWEYCWLNEDKQIIVITRSDVTNSQILQQRSEEMMAAKTSFDRQGRPVSAILTIHDITKQREREELIRELTNTIGTNQTVHVHDPLIVTQILQYLYNTNNTEVAIKQVLSLLGSHYGMGRVYICEDDSVRKTSNCTFEWCASGVESLMQNLQNMYDDLMGNAYDMLPEDGNICYFTEGLPQEAENSLAGQGIHGLCICNIMDEGDVFGRIGFHDCTGKVVWTEEMKGTISLAAMLVGTFLTNRRKKVFAELSEDFLAALDDNASYIYIVDSDTYQVVYTNKSIRDRSDDFLKGSTCYSQAIGKDVPCENCPILCLNKSGYSEPVEVLRKDGAWMLSQASHIHWEGRQMYMVTCTDITERKKYEAELCMRNSEYAAIVQQSGKQIISYDLSSDSVTIFFDKDKKFGKKHRIENFPEKAIKMGNITPESVEAYREFFGRMHEGKPHGTCDISIKEPDGCVRWERADYTLIDGTNGVPTHAIISYCDITEDREKEKLIVAASLDTMTGLLNRGAMEHFVNDKLTGARTDERFALFMLDVDNFKMVNDAMGHQQGDDILVNVAKAMRNTFRSEDLLCRFGGDEYMTLIWGNVDIEIVREKTRDLLEAVQFSKGDVITTASIGVCLTRDSHLTFEQMYRIADKALYSAKRGGKNRCCVLDGHTELPVE